MNIVTILVSIEQVNTPQILVRQLTANRSAGSTSRSNKFVSTEPFSSVYQCSSWRARRRNDNTIFVWFFAISSIATTRIDDTIGRVDTTNVEIRITSIPTYLAIAPFSPKNGRDMYSLHSITKYEKIQNFNFCMYRTQTFWF